jgi:hypothetical protein
MYRSGVAVPPIWSFSAYLLPTGVWTCIDMSQVAEKALNFQVRWVIGSLPVPNGAILR